MWSRLSRPVILPQARFSASQTRMNSNFPTLKKAASSGHSTPGSPQFFVGGVDLRPLDAQRSDDALFFRAVLVGTLAAAVGTVLYATFTIASHIEIGLAAIGVGYLIGKAIQEATKEATGGVGGLKYQTLAVVLTYFSVSLARLPELLWHWHGRGVDITHLTSDQILTLVKYGVAAPFFDLTSGIGPGLISFLILSAGIQQAWRLTAPGYKPR